MGIIVPQPAPSAERGAQLTEDFARRMAGLGNMEGVELQRWQRQRAAGAQREAQLEALASMLSDRADQASEVERSLRESGMADVADRFRRSTRRSAFNMARRGLTGGSAAIEGQQEAQVQAENEAAGVAEEARLSALGQALKAQQTRDRLAQEVIRQDPFAAQAEQFQIGGIQQATADAARVAEARRQADAARRAGRGLGIAALADTVGGVGESFGNMIGNAPVGG